jgi:hypothetical protein
VLWEIRVLHRQSISLPKRQFAPKKIAPQTFFEPYVETVVEFFFANSKKNCNLVARNKITLKLKKIFSSTIFAIVLFFITILVPQNKVWAQTYSWDLSNNYNLSDHNWRDTYIKMNPNGTTTQYDIVTSAACYPTKSLTTIGNVTSLSIVGGQLKYWNKDWVQGGKIGYVIYDITASSQVGAYTYNSTSPANVNDFVNTYTNTVNVLSGLTYCHTYQVRFWFENWNNCADNIAGTGNCYYHVWMNNSGNNFCYQFTYVRTTAAPTLTGSSVASGANGTITITNHVTGDTYELYEADGSTQITSGFTQTNGVITVNSSLLASSHSFKVKNTCNGQMSSASTTITVLSCTPPSLPSITTNSPICYNTAGTITLGSFDGTNHTYELWTSDLSTQVGTFASATYTTNNLSANTSFKVKMIQKSDLTCYNTSGDISITVTPDVVLPTLTGSSVCAGNSGTITLTSFNDATYTYTLLNSSDNSLVSPTPSYSTGVFTVADMSATSIYKVLVINKSNTSCTKITTSTATITVNAPNELPYGDNIVYYHNNLGWTTVKAYTYDGETLGGWSGTAMNQVGTTNFYWIDLNGTPSYIIFNQGNSTNQHEFNRTNHGFYNNTNLLFTVPTPPSLTTNSPVAPGNNATITISNYNAANTYLLYEGSTLIGTFSSSTYTINAPANGSHTYTVRLQNVDLSSRCLYIKSATTITVESCSTPPVASVSGNDVCYGTSNSTLTIFGYNDALYDYQLWNAGNTAQVTTDVTYSTGVFTIANLATTTSYTVRTFPKGLSCYSSSASTAVTVRPAVVATVSTMPALEGGGTDGSITVNITAGLPNFEISIGGTVKGSSLALGTYTYPNYAANTYSLVITSSNNCSLTTSAIVVESDGCMPIYPATTNTSSTTVANVMRPLSEYMHDNCITNCSDGVHAMNRVWITKWACPDDTMYVEFNSHPDAGATCSQGLLKNHTDDDVYTHIWASAGYTLSIPDTKMKQAYVNSTTGFAIYYEKIIIPPAQRATAIGNSVGVIVKKGEAWAANNCERTNDIFINLHSFSVDLVSACSTVAKNKNIAFTYYHKIDNTPNVGNLCKAEIDFGNGGGWENVTTAMASATGTLNLTHSYATSGTKTIKVRSKSFGGATREAQITITVLDVTEPTITLSVDNDATPSTVTINEGESFTVTATLSNQVPHNITVPIILDPTSPNKIYLKGVGNYNQPGIITVPANTSSASITFYTTDNLYPENTRYIKFNHGTVTDGIGCTTSYSFSGNPVTVEVLDRDDNICSQSVYPANTYFNSNITQLPPDTIRDLSQYETGARIFTTAYAAKEDKIVVEYNSFWDAGWSNNTIGAPDNLDKYIDDNVYIHVWVKINGADKIVSNQKKMIRDFVHDDTDNGQDFAIYHHTFSLIDSVRQGKVGDVTLAQLDTIGAFYYTIKKNPTMNGGGHGDMAKILHHTAVAIAPHYQNIDFGDPTSNFIYTHSLSTTNDIATMTPNPANMCFAYYQLDNEIPVNISSELRAGNGTYTIPAIPNLSAGIHKLIATSYTTGGGILSDTIYIAVNPAVVLTVNNSTSDTINETGSPHSATITATLQNAALAPGDVVVTLDITGGIYGIDYTLSSTTITIPAGQNSASITLTAIDNDVCNDIHLTITAINPIPCDVIPTLLLISTSSLSVTITNTDESPTDITITTNCNGDIIITKGEKGLMPFNIVLSNSMLQPIASGQLTETFLSFYNQNIGNYSVAISDAGGCPPENKLVTVTGRPVITLDFEGVTCNSNDDITINVLGGKTFADNKYDIRIDNSSSQNLQSSGWTVSFSTPCLHKIEVIDGTGCVVSKKLNVVK